ncbi:short-chain dehydrogenase [Campylobacter mucosalis]|uniref:pirin family protein n=1 Tax=Campylobacter mucosalis TaxID=202 RepID=UPI0004DA4554|nr:pirin family protein [Campylobacter mucosalis]KEA45245.1 short-chain dehydrogenase [Campylobacter mucosalis]QKF63748.1 pirin family protein [Campylobacter mucosalis]
MRNVFKIYKAKSSHWVGDGFKVSPLFSHMDEDKGTNPFLMLDYAAPQFYEPNYGKPRGVGKHPHKGFETVTIAYSGEVAHRDSSGGGGVIKPGDVQWMTAGAGIIHEEFHSENYSKSGREFEIAQLWVNLPKAHKLTPPKYQHLAKENIPVVEFDGGFVRVIAGNFNGTKGAASTFSVLNVWDIVINADKTANFSVPSNQSLSLVVLRGDLEINGKDRATQGDLVGFELNGGDISVKAQGKDAKILLLSGEPINEPVVGYGPFVMNSAGEIREAINEFNSGKFGKI